VLALLVLFLVFSQFGFFSPVRDGLRRSVALPAHWVDVATTRVIDAFKVLFTVNNLARENAELKTENTELKAKAASLEALKVENDNLYKDLQFKKAHPQMRLTPANVVGYSPTGLYQTLIIDRGSRDGLKENQVVVASGYLIGKVGKVSLATSEVWLLANRNLLTPVILAKTGTIGLLRGSIRGLIVENIPLDTKTKIGEAVVTSSLEGIYPAGIAVGHVVDIISAKEEIFLTLRIENPVSVGNLTSVLIVTK